MKASEAGQTKAKAAAPGMAKAAAPMKLTSVQTRAMLASMQAMSKAKAKAAAPKAVTEKALQAKAAAPEPWATEAGVGVWAHYTPAHIEAMKAGKAFCKCCQASVCDGFCKVAKLTCEFCEANSSAPVKAKVAAPPDRRVPVNPPGTQRLPVTPPGALHPVARVLPQGATLPGTPPGPGRALTADEIQAHAKADFRKAFPGKAVPAYFAPFSRRC